MRGLLSLSLYCSRYSSFIDKHPALLYGTSMVIGFRAAFSWYTGLIIPLVIIALPVLIKRQYTASISCRQRSFLALILCMICFFSAHMTYRFPHLSEEGAVGTAHIDISSISRSRSHFGEAWVYRGTIHSFTHDKNLIAKNTPYIMYLAAGEHRPHANKHYLISGALIPTDGHTYRIKPDKNKKWYPIKRSWSIAEYRYTVKNAISNHLHEKLHHRQSADFLTGLATGEYNDRNTLFQLGKLGLQHIMAISGFHFAIVTALLSLLLRTCFSLHKSSLILIGFLTAYFIFIGCAPSIQRAWLSSVIVLSGVLIGKPTYALNTLGVAMMSILASNPILCMHLGFQFSFIATAAIVTLTSPVNRCIQHIFPSRPLSKMIQLPLYEQCGYVIVSLFKASLSLTIAVHILAVPMALLYFNTFPLLSLIFNLFFPFLVSIAIVGLIITMAIDAFLSIAATPLYYIIDSYSTALMNFTTSIPTAYNIIIRTRLFSPTLFTIYLCVIALLVIAYYGSEQQEEYRWEFI